MRGMPAVFLAAACAVLVPKVAAAQERYDPNKYDPVKVERHSLDEQNQKVRRYEAQQEEERQRKAAEDERLRRAADEEKTAEEERQRNAATREPDQAAQSAADARVPPVATGNWVRLHDEGGYATYLDYGSISRSAGTRSFNLKMDDGTDGYLILHVAAYCHSGAYQILNVDYYDVNGRPDPRKQANDPRHKIERDSPAAKVCAY